MNFGEEFPEFGLSPSEAAASLQVCQGLNSINHYGLANCGVCYCCLLAFALKMIFNMRVRVIAEASTRVFSVVL
jgi:hypothetical protein